MRQTRLPIGGAGTTMPVLPEAVRNLSYSRLTQLESCPRRFYLQYVEGVPPDGFERAESWLGTLVHETLEWTYQEVGERRVPERRAILAEFLRRFDSRWGPQVLVTRNDRGRSFYRELGVRCLSSYAERHYPFLASETLALEAEVTFPVDLDGASATFAGYIDRLAREPDGAYIVEDYKTGSRTINARVPRETYQLAVYAAGLRRSGRVPDDEPIRLRWHFLQLGQEITVEATPELVHGAASWVQQAGTEARERIESGEAAFPPQPSVLCRWCDRAYACGAFPREYGSPPIPLVVAARPEAALEGLE